jgi:hypothetical protein
MIDFLNTSTKLLLRNADGTLVDNYPVLVKYFESYDQTWVTLYAETINKGGLHIQRSINTATPEEGPYFNRLRDEQVPPLIIVPAAPPVGGTLPKIIASTFAFNVYNNDIYEFDFGALWLAPEDAITGIAGNFKGFQPIASCFPFECECPETPETTAVPINELYTDIVTEIENATRASASSAFKLSNISLKLKAVIQRDGESVSAALLDIANSDNINGNAISELTFDITPTQSGETTMATLPDLSGLTETAVRRVLKSLNLRLNPVYQKNMDVVNGDSFKQSPASGDSIQPNQLITVIFSKHE